MRRMLRSALLQKTGWCGGGGRGTCALMVLAAIAPVGATPTPTPPDIGISGLMEAYHASFGSQQVIDPATLPANVHKAGNRILVAWTSRPSFWTQAQNQV